VQTTPAGIVAAVSTSSSPQRAEFGPGTQVGGYRIEVRVGEGGMGEVFRAQRVDDGQIVALKAMKSKFSTDSDYTRRFLREARAAGEIEHPHLVGVIDFGEHEGRPFLVMRYLPGPTVEGRIGEQGPLSIEATARLVGEVGGALNALHQHGLVHRDVKASNIIFDGAGSAALADFGLAKGTGYSVLTRPGQMMGTLDYLAPELIRGEDATPASDIYALGCVVYECLSGQPPFGQRGMFQVGMGHLEETPSNPCAGRTDIAEEYGQFACMALAKDPAQRPSTALAYAQTLIRAAHAAGH
jgi:serine/threonine protein kinase